MHTTEQKKGQGNGYRVLFNPVPVTGMSVRGRQRRQADPKTGRLFRVIGPLPKLASPPRALRRAKLDNLTLVPGNLLPLKAQYQRIANALPAGDVLVILPSGHRPVRNAVQTVVDLVRAKGQHVTTLSTEHFLHHRDYPALR